MDNCRSNERLARYYIMSRTLCPAWNNEYCIIGLSLSMVVVLFPSSITVLRVCKQRVGHSRTAGLCSWSFEGIYPVSVTVWNTLLFFMCGMRGVCMCTYTHAHTHTSVVQLRNIRHINTMLNPPLDYGPWTLLFALRLSTALVTMGNTNPLCYIYGISGTWPHHPVWPPPPSLKNLYITLFVWNVSVLKSVYIYDCVELQ